MPAREQPPSTANVKADQGQHPRGPARAGSRNTRLLGIEPGTHGFPWRDKSLPNQVCACSRDAHPPHERELPSRCFGEGLGLTTLSAAARYIAACFVRTKHHNSDWRPRMGGRPQAAPALRMRTALPPSNGAARPPLLGQRASRSGGGWRKAGVAMRRPYMRFPAPSWFLQSWRRSSWRQRSAAM